MPLQPNAGCDPHLPRRPHLPHLPRRPLTPRAPIVLSGGDRVGARRRAQVDQAGGPWRLRPVVHARLPRGTARVSQHVQHSSELTHAPSPRVRTVDRLGKMKKKNYLLDSSELLYGPLSPPPLAPSRCSQKLSTGSVN